MLSSPHVPRSSRSSHSDAFRYGPADAPLQVVRRRCLQAAVRRTDALDRLQESLSGAYAGLEEASEDARLLVETYSADDDYSRERMALHLRARLEGLVQQVQETAVEVSELCAAARRLQQLEHS